MLKRKVRQLRIEAKVTTEEAIKKLNISYSFLIKIELGYRKPGRDLIEEMSRLYKCSIEDIYKALDEEEYYVKPTEVC